MQKKRYISVDLISKRPPSEHLTKEEKCARIYDLACKMQVKIGKEKEENVYSKGK